MVSLIVSTVTLVMACLVFEKTPEFDKSLSLVQLQSISLVQLQSIDSAYADLQRIAGPEPTPIGSVGSDAIRDHLAAVMSAAGFNVEVQTGVGSQTFQSTTVAGRVDNVVATLPGNDSTGSVVLAAHYDSTFGTPGAADDKASVVAMLETARALASAGGPCAMTS